MEKEKVLSLFQSADQLSLNDIEKFLSSDDKDIKHEAWNYVLKKAKYLPHSFLVSLLKFPDTGTRYRAWNSLLSFISEGLISVEEAKSYKEYFIEMLRDSNLTVRFLSWYVTLKQVLDLNIVNEEDIKKEKKYLIELLQIDEYKELVNELLSELKM